MSSSSSSSLSIPLLSSSPEAAISSRKGAASVTTTAATTTLLTTTSTIASTTPTSRNRRPSVEHGSSDSSFITGSAGFSPPIITTTTASTAGLATTTSSSLSKRLVVSSVAQEDHNNNYDHEVDDEYEYDYDDDDDHNHHHHDKLGIIPNSNTWYRWSVRELHKWQRRVPLLKRMVDVIRRVPPKHRWTFLIVWVLWKVIALVIAVRLVWQHAAGHGNGNNSISNNNMDSNLFFGGGDSGMLLDGSISSTTSRASSQQHPLKILYIVTSLAEYNTGTRNTVKGQDRLADVMLPVLVDSVDSMVHHPYYYQVDVFLILAFTLRPEREELIRSRLPPGVGLQVWDDAAPLGYDSRNDPTQRILDNSRALSRQHRYVIKDKLPYYDFFVVFEDDMRITGDHVHHFIHMSRELDRLRAQAPRTLPDVPENMNPLHMKYFGPMTKRQMQRLIPGFIRVEVLLNETAFGAQTKLDPIPLDFQFPVGNTEAAHKQYEEKHLDPTICCHVHMSPNKETPVHPSASDVIIWETSVKALSVRRLPTSNSPLDWVVLLPGPGKRLPAEELVGGYWSGRGPTKGAFDKKPSPGMPDLIAQQGGWMASRHQLIELQTEKNLCQGSFLPPYDEPVYFQDGQESMNVEFWSGGYQFFTGVRGGCNMQRVISLTTPQLFSKSLIYHVANNKQRQLARQRMLKADNLLGQLNSVRKAAERAMVVLMAQQEQQQQEE